MILEAIGGPRDGERLRVPTGESSVTVGAAPTGHLIGVQRECLYVVEWTKRGHEAPRVLAFHGWIDREQSLI